MLKPTEKDIVRYIETLTEMLAYCEIDESTSADEVREELYRQLGSARFDALTQKRRA